MDSTQNVDLTNWLNYGLSKNYVTIDTMISILIKNNQYMHQYNIPYAVPITNPITTPIANPITNPIYNFNPTPTDPRLRDPRLVPDTVNTDTFKLDTFKLDSVKPNTDVTKFSDANLYTYDTSYIPVPSSETISTNGTNTGNGVTSALQNLPLQPIINRSNNRYERYNIYSNHNVCPDWLKGSCRTSRCKLDHHVYSGFKTIICKHWLVHNCKFCDIDCRHAHGSSDIYDHKNNISKYYKSNYSDRYYSKSYDYTHNRSRSRSRSRSRDRYEKKSDKVENKNIYYDDKK